MTPAKKLITDEKNQEIDKARIQNEKIVMSTTKAMKEITKYRKNPLFNNEILAGGNSFLRLSKIKFIPSFSWLPVKINEKKLFSAP
jgi:hypothetical protein